MVPVRASLMHKASTLVSGEVIFKYLKNYRHTVPSGRRETACSQCLAVTVSHERVMTLGLRSGLDLKIWQHQSDGLGLGFRPMPNSKLVHMLSFSVNQ